MTTAEETARAAMLASKTVNQAQQLLTDESRILLAGLLRDEMRVAVAEGIAAAVPAAIVAVMTDEAAEKFWAEGLEVLQRQATVQTGRFVLDGVTSLAKRLFWIALFVVVVYSVGGFSGLKVAWTALSKG